MIKTWRGDTIEGVTNLLKRYICSGVGCGVYFGLGGQAFASIQGFLEPGFRVYPGIWGPGFRVHLGIWGSGFEVHSGT